MFDQTDHIARPADRHGTRRHGIFEDQRPADHPGDHFAHHGIAVGIGGARDGHHRRHFGIARSEEHTSELQSLMRISYAVFCLKKKKTKEDLKLYRSHIAMTHHSIKTAKDYHIPTNSSKTT